MHREECNMNQSHFILLADAEQMDILYTHGVYIDKRKEGSNTMLLYQLKGFYVEVCYYKYRQVIAWIRCSESVKILEPYLEKMDIAELVTNGER
jgi:hypothetical protein